MFQAAVNYRGGGAEGGRYVDSSVASHPGFAVRPRRGKMSGAEWHVPRFDWMVGGGEINCVSRRRCVGMVNERGSVVMFNAAYFVNLVSTEVNANKGGEGCC